MEKAKIPFDFRPRTKDCPVELKEFILLVISLMSSLAGQYLLKLGALKLGSVNTNNVAAHILGISTTPELLAGLTCYGLGAVAYILLLTRVKLSIVAPSAALVYIFSVLIGYFVFREPIPLSRVVGLGLITSGVILVLWKG